jgi:hypothetical protein
MSQSSRFEPYSTPDVLDYGLQCAIMIGAVTLLLTIIGATFFGATAVTVWLAVIAAIVWFVAFILRLLLHRYWQ